MTQPFFPLDRRGFLKSSGLLATVPWMRQDARAAVSKDDPDALKVGLVGCGGRGSGAALQAMNAEDGTVLLTAMADLFPDRIERSHGLLKEALGEHAGRLQVDPEQRFSGFDAYEQLLATDVDVVLLTTPPVFRPMMLAAAIAAGKHVFCEKPMAVDAPGVRSVLATAEAAKAAKLSLVAGFCWRYNVRHRALYQRVQDGALGDLRAIYSTYLASPNRSVARGEGWTEMEWNLRNWYQVLWASGDHVLEQACHSLDKMAWATGDTPPLRVMAVGGRQAKLGPNLGNIYDHFTATFDYPDDVKGFHVCRQMDGCATDNSDWVMGAKGNAYVNGWADRHEISGENAWAYEGPGNDMYQQEHDELFASIRSAKPINDGTWMATSTLLGVMTRMSAYTGDVITWEQALASEEKLAPDVFEFGPNPLRPVAIPGQTKFF